jgi:hypothetical protein
VICPNPAPSSFRVLAVTQAVTPARGDRPMMTSQVLRVLESRGLVTRTADLDDSRALRLAVTNRGARLAQEAVGWSRRPMQNSSQRLVTLDQRCGCSAAGRLTGLTLLPVTTWGRGSRPRMGLS